MELQISVVIFSVPIDIVRNLDRRVMMKGTINKVIPERGFGFIVGEDKSEYFFHRSDFDGDFDELTSYMVVGQVKVSFLPDRTLKGLRARAVTIE